VNGFQIFNLKDKILLKFFGICYDINYKIF